MSDGMDLDLPTGMPGGDSFEDITDTFRDAGKDLATEELLLTEGFTLMDAMSAFEIGEPRMDSGMSLEQDVASTFDPLALLLPEELCWILDRTFACEMQWHTGNTLSQSVFTLLFVHQLADINPDLLPAELALGKDVSRPIELITVVLRSTVFALLKSCDLVWRELAKKRVQDVEDWQSDKCDVTLLEGVPIAVVLQKLDDALTWVRHSTIPLIERDMLCDRLLLRKTLLELFRLNTLEDLDELKPLVTIAKNILRRIESNTPASPQPGSPALHCFDPRVTRRLHTIVPIRILELPPQAEVWKSLRHLLHGWDHIARLREIHSLATWKVACILDAWGSRDGMQFPYIRSLTQSAFSDHNTVLGEYPLAWLVDQFFEDTLGIPYQYILNYLPDDWMGHGRWSTRDVEAHIVKIVSDFIKQAWFNPPRRRRALMRAIDDWQILHEALLTMSAQIMVEDNESAMIAVGLPKAAVLWKLTVAQEIVLSGFQQQLYAPHERAVAYWFLAHILEQHLDCLESLRSFMPMDCAAYEEMLYQSEFLSALQLMSLALCALTSRDLTQSMERMVLNYSKRYKWVPTDETGRLLLPLPPFEQFPSDLQTLYEDETFVPYKYIRHAERVFSDLAQQDTYGVCGREESDRRKKFVTNLATVAGELAKSVRRANASSPLVWDEEYHPWFPRCDS